MLPLQDFDFDIMHTPRPQHVVPNYLSRIETREAPTGIADDFPDTFKIQVDNQNYANNPND